MNIKFEPAIDAARNLLICMGGIGISVFISTLHWYLWLPCALVVFGTWYILYLIEIHPKRDYVQRVIENSKAWKAVHE
jgi:hypothetical protein